MVFKGLTYLINRNCDKIQILTYFLSTRMNADFINSNSSQKTIPYLGLFDECEFINLTFNLYQFSEKNLENLRFCELPGNYDS